MVYEYDHFTESERRGKLLKDTHPDEHATCYVVQGRGLVDELVAPEELRARVQAYGEEDRKSVV